MQARLHHRVIIFQQLASVNFAFCSPSDTLVTIFFFISTVDSPGMEVGLHDIRPYEAANQLRPVCEKAGDKNHSTVQIGCKEMTKDECER